MTDKLICPHCEALLNFNTQPTYRVYISIATEINKAGLFEVVECSVCNYIGKRQKFFTE